MNWIERQVDWLFNALLFAWDAAVFVCTGTQDSAFDVIAHAGKTLSPDDMRAVADYLRAVADLRENRKQQQQPRATGRNEHGDGI